MNWISVKDRLPDWDVYTLWVLKSGIMFIDDIDHDNSWKNFKLQHEYNDFAMNHTDEITHWMPLPEPPKQLKP